MYTRKQYLDYKLQFNTAGDSVMNAAYVAELDELNSNIDFAIRQYEHKFNESFSKSSGGVGGGSAPVSAVINVSK